MNKYLLLTAITAALALSACTAQRVSNFPSYKLKIQQGNELDAQAVAQLQPGLSRQQVQMLLGTPTLRDPFHADRWDYTYAISRNGVVREQQTLTVYFNGDSLARVEGSALESVRQQLQQQPQAAPAPSAPVTNAPLY